MRRILLCVVYVFIFFVSNAQYSLNYGKIHGGKSGNNQSEYVNSEISDSIFCSVIDSNNKPVSNYKVIFKIISKPSKSNGFVIFDSICYTNSRGECGTKVKLGNTSGEYTILASIKSDASQNSLIYSFEAKSKLWILFLIIGLLGGLTLFLYGMNTMSSGMQKTAGNKMRSILSSLTKNNFIGLTIGAIVTAIVQSSSATSVMLVSFVNSGLMRFRQSLSILLGAMIGSTITVQLISFKLTDYSLAFVAVGGVLYMFGNKNSLRFIGESLFGFGMLFFGMEVMSQAIAPIKSSSFFIHAFTTLHNPLYGLIVGTLFTAIIQSSAASIGIFIILASQGLLSFESSLGLILGANLGTPITALIASIKTSKDAKRVAYSLLFFKIIMMAIFIWFLPFISKHVVQIAGTNNMSQMVPRAIANVHTYINIITVLIIFPVLPLIEKVIIAIKPVTLSESKQVITKYIDSGFLNQPAIAVQLAKEEMMRLSRKIQFSLELILAPFTENKPEYLEELNAQRLLCKDIRDEIKQYLLQINQYDKSTKRSEEIFTLMHTLTELSHINDALTKVLHRRAEKWIERNYNFTESEKNDIRLYHTKTLQLYNSSMQVFADFTIEDALKVRKKAKQQSKEALDLEKSHFQRLLDSENDEFTNSKTYLELINMFKIIGEHSVNIIPNTH